MNENFTNNTHAASRYVGTAAGNVMEVGAYGLGGNSIIYTGGVNGFASFHTGKSAFILTTHKVWMLTVRMFPIMHHMLFQA